MEHLATLPSATIRRGTEVTGVTQTEDGVRLSVSRRDRRNSGRRIGGLRGRRRRSPQSAAGGAGHRDGRPRRHDERARCRVPRPAVAGAGRPPLRPLHNHPPRRCRRAHPGRPGRSLAVRCGAREKATTPTALGDHDALLHRIRSAAGVPDLPVDIVRVHPFGSGAQLADRFSEGRVFLVGDAAHRVTPRGGNGLAMAVRDGIDLGWRLAWVVRGWAPQSFLATYETECRPVVADSVMRAADPDSGCRAVISEMQQDLGGRIQHAWVGPGISTLDLVGPGLTLLTADPADWAAAVTELDSWCPCPSPSRRCRRGPPTPSASTSQAARFSSGPTACRWGRGGRRATASQISNERLPRCSAPHPQSSCGLLGART